MDESYEWDAADFSTQPGAQDGEHFVFLTYSAVSVYYKSYRGTYAHLFLRPRF